MMREFFPVIFATTLILVIGLVEILLLRFFNPAWWRIRWIRRTGWGLPLFGTVAVFFWGFGRYKSIDWLVTPAAVVVALSFILLMALMLSLPVSGFFHLLHWVAGKFQARRRETLPGHARSRRLFLKGVAAAVPVVTVTMGAGGVARAFGSVSVPRRTVRVAGLPPDLEGLKILHISDSHLRDYVTLADLETVVENAAPAQPDLILVTGDIADDLSLLPEALRMIDSLRAPLGTFACLGNHEYFRGIERVRKIFDQSPVPLLINEGLPVTVGSASLFIGGTDDPQHMGAKQTAFFERVVDESIRESRSDDIILLMSHRPDAFDRAAARDIELTLSGHTHGGQFGVFGRSIFEPVWPDRYLWGLYHRDDSTLHTSAGMGHWFPFRLGCPPETPVLELRAGTSVES